MVEGFKEDSITVMEAVGWGAMDEAEGNRGFRFEATQLAFFFATWNTKKRKPMA